MAQTLTPKNFILAISAVVLVWVPVIYFHLTIALLAFLITYTASRRLSLLIRKSRVPQIISHSLSLIIVLSILVLFLAYLVNFTLDASQHRAGLTALSQRSVDILSQVKFSLPDIISEHIPANIDQIRTDVAQWIANNSRQVQAWSRNAIHAIGYALFGILIGAVALFQIPDQLPLNEKPLTQIFFQQFHQLCSAFSDVVYAQIPISAINTLLTACYLFIILPLFDVKLPLSTTLIVFTFLVGLVPILGNLLSSMAIIIMSFGDSNFVVIMSMIWMPLIHKLEYFLNAHIVGNKIHAKAWELLVVMLVFEAVVGLMGVVIAPIIYAQIKKNCKQQGWIN